jgi:uncharacterized membrane protein
MTVAVTALYDELTTARRAVEQLVSSGVDRDQISLVANDASNKYASYLKDDNVTGEEGAGFGATVGALVGLGAMLIPGIGPVIAGGPLVAALVGAGVGAATGALTGGITASLVDMGIDEETAGYYAEGVRRGGSLVVAHVPDGNQNRVMDIMNRFNPVDLKVRTDEWRSTGWTRFDERDSAYTRG